MTTFSRAGITFVSGGDHCSAWLYRPEGTGTVPGVVMAHGFTAVRDQGLNAYAEAFAAAGIGVLLFDYRHFGASDGEPRQLLSVQHQLEDWKAAIKTLREQPDIDPERIALWGTSFGGAHVQAIAAVDHRIAAVVAQIPFCWAEKPQQKIPLSKTLWLLLSAVKDSLRGLLGLTPHYIQAIGDPDDHAAMTSPGAAAGIASITPADSGWRNRVAARFVFQLASYKPGKQAGSIQCPIHYTIAEQDAFISPSTIREAAALAPHAEIASYDCGHFGVYVEPVFNEVARDETAFLVRTLHAEHADLVHSR
ncbi:MAG: alpha/beta fold hydrolase [Haliea sp.]|nr:alpha/beta fold hydrolase [Haliea sp.]